MKSEKTTGNDWTIIQRIGVSALMLLLCITTPLSAQESRAEDGERANPADGLAFLDTGPLRVREQFSLTQGFLSFEPSSADVLDRGEWQIDLVFGVTNNWVHSQNVEDRLEARSQRGEIDLEFLRETANGRPSGSAFISDGELYRSSLSVRRGIGRRTQISIDIPVLDFEGGFADSTIEGFHDTFGFGQAGREGAFRDGFLVYLKAPGGHELFIDDDPGTGLGDVKLGVKTLLRSPRGWNIAGAAVLKLPTGDEEKLYGTGSFDGGVEILATRYWSRSCFHAGATLSWLGEANVLGIDEQTAATVMLGYEYGIGSRTSLIVQATASQSPLKDLDIQDIDDIAYLVDIGIKHALDRKTVLFLAFTENLVNFDNSLDVGLHIGLTKTF